jgi:hypothetical protein
LPVFGSRLTKSAALLAAEAVLKKQPPLRTSQLSEFELLFQRCEIAVFRARDELYAVPPHRTLPAAQSM